MSPRDRRATLRAAFYIANTLGVIFALLLTQDDDYVALAATGLLWIALNVTTVLVQGGSTLFGLFPKVEEPSEGEKSDQP